MTRIAEIAADTLVAYEEDFALWAEQQACLIEQSRFHEMDRTNLADEVADLARNEKRALRSNLVVVLKHLLKCRYQPERLSRSWLATLDEHRSRIAEILDDSPSLRRVLREYFPTWYGQARRQAAHEMEKPRGDIDKDCPFTLQQALDPDWLPPEAGLQL
ncbi:MAG: DUF29 family protein [Gammaproteobacteria bacterium]|nr:DUF29 family protein [Gammaproteobacteria bacterium]